MTVDAPNSNNNIGNLWYTPAGQKKKLPDEGALSLGGGVGFAPNGASFADTIKSAFTGSSAPVSSVPVSCAEDH